VDTWLLGAGIVGLVVLLLGTSGVVIGSRRLASRVRSIAGAAPTADPVAAVSALRARNANLEVELAADRHDHDLLLESLAQGVVWVDGGLRINGANSAAHGFLGRAPGGLIGRSLIEAFLDPQVEAIARSALDQGSASGEVGRFEGGNPRLLVRARRSSAGGAWLVLEDVSELRRLQQIRTEFIDNLSHELRTPLTTVSLLAETLSREADSAGGAIPTKMRDRIGKIEVETGHLVQMVSELLDLSRIESGGSIQAVDLVDLGQVAGDSVERLRLFADRQGVSFRVEVADRLPPVRGDAARLGQVYINLLHNAVKFSPDGGDVAVRVRVEGDRVVSEVADQGVGIPRAAQARIFERFYKVDRARVRGETGGTGLGLSIARHIIDHHGGTIGVESTEGVGSTFRFSLPLATPDQDTQRP
jgi:two-component system phosphate regulon sensor histidine kinase PhoR